jgi:hypothetical protein
VRGMIGGRRVGGDTPELGERAVEFVERWRRERRERRGNYWLKRLMAVPDENTNEKEADDGR